MAPNKKNNTNNTSTTVSPPHSHSGQVRSDPPASKPCKHGLSSVDTTVEPAAKKATTNPDELDAEKDESKVKKGRGRREDALKDTADKEEEDEAASSTKDLTSGATTEATAAAGVAIKAATINTEINQASEITTGAITETGTIETLATGAIEIFTETIGTSAEATIIETVNEINTMNTSGH
ncbi:hypothetical protein BDQ17DRAFT_1430629 [Cyathus striatus]|nr:hypothetical protein BDQ17DRAFT_1430629 [Cyathus striatus]